MEGSVQLGLLNRPLGFLGLAVLIVVQLLCTIAMFQVLRAGMPMLLRASDASGAEGVARWTGGSRLVDAIAVALLPFFAYYATWGLLRDLVSDYSYSVLQNIAGLGLAGPQDIAAAPGLWISIAATWAVRRLSLARHEQTRSHWWSIVATVCEAYWVFLRRSRDRAWKQAPWDWWHQRAVYVGWREWWNDPRAWLTVLESGVTPLLELARAALSVTILPLVWLAIAAIIYGHDLREQSTLTQAHARVTRLHQRYAGLPPMLRWFAGSWSKAWRSRFVPVLNSLRLLLRAGLRPALMVCVGYVILHFVCSWAFRGAVLLIGPQDRDVWSMILGPLTLIVGDASAHVPSLLEEPLRICLLAAAIEIAVREAQSAGASAALTGSPQTTPTH